MVIFGTLFGVGALMLLFSVIFGHDHDFDHGDMDMGGHDVDHGDGGPRFLNMRILSSFMTAFGAAGLLARAYGYSAGSSSLFGVFGGIALGAVMYYLLKFTFAQQASSHVTSQDILNNRIAVVSVTIPPHGQGEVSLSVKGSQYTYIARSNHDTAIREGSRVLIVDMIGDGVIVTPAQ